MNSSPSSAPGTKVARANLILGGLTVGFLVLAALFTKNLWGHTAARKEIPLVDKKFLETTPWRQTYKDLVKAKEDLSDYDCYGCHEKNKAPTIRFDAAGKIIIPKEHSNIVMGHGSHDRNNLCFNCHNENNLTTLQSRDGHEVKFDNIPALCGSCHGPTLRDWEAGAHGRTSGFWDRSQGEMSRLVCANCHNPHSPKIPTREPAPGPHALRATTETHESEEAHH
jgi:formate-dependent nitrite reductase cytochrome c552 subunit